MSPPRDRIWATADGRFTLRICWVAGEPHAWVTAHLPGSQTQHMFPEGTGAELCRLAFPPEKTDGGEA